MSKIKMTINNREVEAYEGQTVLEAAKNNGIHIPTLCYLKDVTGTGACRVCQVEIEGAKTLCAACVYPVREGLVVKTNSQRALDARRRVVELIVSNHSKDCLSCIRNTNCELQRLCQELLAKKQLLPLMKFRLESFVILQSVSFAAAALKHVLKPKV